LSTPRYQWISPLGRFSSPHSYEDIVALIEQGRFFPPQLISVDESDPVEASSLDEFKDIWTKVVPPITPFENHSGRLKPLVLAQLFAHLSMSRATGYLYLKQSFSGLYFAFRFVEGQVLEICAHDPSSYLGQLLIQQSLITPDQLNAVLKDSQNQTLPFGQICLQHELITQKQLNQILAEQLFIRVRRIACFPYSDVIFRADRRARMSRPLGRISGYSLVEICLGYGLSDQEIRTYIQEELTTQPLEVDWSTPGIQLLSAEDRSVLKRFESQGHDLRVLTQRPGWTHRDGALKAISWDLVKAFKIPRCYQLLEEYRQLEGNQALSHLGIGESDDLNEVEVKIQNFLHYLQFNQDHQSKEEEQIKQLIQYRLDELRRSFDVSEREQQILERMQEMGANLFDQNLKHALMFESCMQEGAAALKREKYEQAYTLFTEALTYQSGDLTARLNLTWSQFLASDRNQEIYKRIHDELKTLIRLQPNESEPYLVLARIQRLHGDLKNAELNLWQFIQLNPNHNQAHAELRLLLTREYNQNKRVQAGVNQIPKDQNWVWAAIALLLCSASLWFASTQIKGELEVWPRLPSIAQMQNQRFQDYPNLGKFSDSSLLFNQVLRLNYPEDLIATAAYKGGLPPHKEAKGSLKRGYTLDQVTQRAPEVERALVYLYSLYKENLNRVEDLLNQSNVISPSLDRLGNTERFYLKNDLIWWARRLLLLILAFGLCLWTKPDLDYVKVGSLSYIFLALLYGGLIGWISPTLTYATSTSTLVLMKGVHSLTEVGVFVIIFGVILLKAFKDQYLIPLLILIVTFGVYKLSFFYIWSLGDATSISMNIFKISIFLGGIPFYLLCKSKGIIAPLVVHILITFIPIIKTLSSTLPQ
jgi:hypothetical protein